MLLRCPACKSDGVLFLHQEIAECERCGATYPAPAGIIDFVAGREVTALDAQHYHEEKKVAPDSCRKFARHLLTAADGLLPKTIGKVLEIGAGTGLLTGGLLSECACGSAVVTDISPDMLRICQETVRQTAPGSADRVVFCTYSGKEDILPDSAFDLCIGNSVVHHILNYRDFFRVVRDALAPGGRAVFIEPGAPFHDALTLAMSDALLACDPALDPAWAPVRAWIAETRSRLMFPAVGMEAREDKHIFSREDVTRAAKAAGYGRVVLIPLDRDPEGASAVAGYLRELGVTAARIEEFLPVYASCARHHFRHLPEADRSAMYVIGLRRPRFGRLFGRRRRERLAKVAAGLIQSPTKAVPPTAARSSEYVSVDW